jgi:hypothetical protein
MTDMIMDVVIGDCAGHCPNLDGIDFSVLGGRRVLAENMTDHQSIPEDWAEDGDVGTVLGLQVHLLAVILAHKVGHDVFRPK